MDVALFSKVLYLLTLHLPYTLNISLQHTNLLIRLCTMRLVGIKYILGDVFDSYTSYKLRQAITAFINVT